MKGLTDVLEGIRKAVDREIERYLPRRGFPEDFYGPVWELLDRGGKRLRPALTVLSCKAVGGTLRQALPAATAVEVLHNMTLVHDDIEDASLLRRGKPCIHILYGIPKAINVGDAMLMKVFEIASEGPLPPGIKLELVRLFAKRAYQITWGQAYEFYLKERKRFTERDVVRVLMSKTAALTALATEAGATAGGGSKREVKALREFGENLGLGFQIVDDLLNVVGDVKKYGKEIGGDIREGKPTIMAAHALAMANKRDKRFLLSLLGKPNASVKDIKKAIGIYERYGSIEYAKAKAKAFINEALRPLKGFKDSEAKRQLIELAKFVVEREC